MPFSAPFREPNIAPIFTPGGAVIPWYLLGGVTAAQCVAAYQPKGAADLAASYVNLNNPGTNNAAPGTAPTFAAATGWTFAAASTQYLTTGITPPYTATWSFAVQFSGVGAADSAALFGQLNTNSRHYILPKTSTSRQYTNGSVSPASIAGVVASGNMMAAGTKAYLNGSDEGVTLADGTAAALSIYIGAIHRSASITNYLTGNIQAMAVYNIALSPTQVGLIAAAMAAL